MTDRPRVFRYTIDNRYDESLFSVAVAELEPGVERFGGESEVWGDEEGLTVTPSDFHERFDNPDLDWASLRPGQVYLQGEFDVEGDAESPAGFVVAAGARRWLRIDQLALIKETLKQQYAELLRASGGRG